MRVRITTPLRPTEDPEKVAAAATAWWPAGVASVADGRVMVEAGDLDAFRDRVWQLRIIDTVRSAARADGPRLRLRISKQAALVGRVALPAAPHPLGELQIEAEIEAGDPWADGEALLWWLCPETRDGEIVDPDVQPEG